MSGFSADWLALREPYDARARNPAVLAAVSASVERCSPIRVVDLASGLGAMVRALAPRLSSPQMWCLVDNDSELLGFVRRMIAPSAAFTVDLRRLDLTHDLQDALDGTIDLITASALLDLVSAAWLDRLVSEIARRQLPFYTTLTYDGRAEIEPVDALDATMIAAANTHQRTDKGFGPALGPTAVRAATARLESIQYSVVTGASDWLIGPNDREIQMKIFSIWASAGQVVGGVSRSDMVGWLARRRDAVIAGCSSIRIGHIDVFATPIGTSRRVILNNSS
jgi:hypothetical protein